MSAYHINASIQVIPLASPQIAMPLIDACIQMIQQAGLPYQVTPFQTVIEGFFPEVHKLVADLHAHLLMHAPEDFIVNVQYHVHPEKHVHAEDKTRPYDHGIRRL